MIYFICVQLPDYALLEVIEVPQDNISSLESWTREEIRLLEKMGEFFAAGFLSGTGKPIILRTAEAIKSHLMHAELPAYNGSRLYPSGKASFWEGPFMSFFYVNLRFNKEKLKKSMEQAPEEERKVLQKLAEVACSYPEAEGWTHSIPNYGRILAEGLEGYDRRISAAKARYKRFAEKQVFLEAVTTALDSIRILVGRIEGYLSSLVFDDEEKEENRLKLIKAFNKLLHLGEFDFKEAMVVTNFILYLDGPDNLGRFDMFMEPYFNKSIETGEVNTEEALGWINELWDNVDQCNAWNAALGGTRPNGTDASSQLTFLCLKAAKGKRRPNVALKLRDDTPDHIWNAAIDCISGGTGIPALYGEDNYLKSLEEARLNISWEDMTNYAFGGCTETMIHGCSNVGSLDGDFNTLKVLEETLYRDLEKCITFKEFMIKYKTALDLALDELICRVNISQERKALYHPQLIRSLFIDDCIDSGREYASGGARYNWSVINVMGLGNTVDSLTGVREIVYNKKEIAPDAFLRNLDSNFKDNPLLLMKLKQMPKFGNGLDEVDTLAKDVSSHIFSRLLEHAPWRGGRFIGSCLMFVTYGRFGKGIGATPDGRLEDEPIADSAGAVQGRDRNGPTALLQSVTSLDQIHAPGTLVINIRLGKSILDDTVSREKVKALLKSYFAMGGMQIQVNVVDQEVLKDAMEHPGKYSDLIIRIGGYSEYFNHLSDELKLSVLERVIHGL
jgi:hypothetical protein